MFVPQRALKSSTKPSTIRFQRLAYDLDVHEWIISILKQMLFQPMQIAVGFSFLTRHPLEHTLSYMFAAPELAFAKTRVRTKVWLFYIFILLSVFRISYSNL